MSSSEKRCFSAYTVFANDSVEGTIYIPGNFGKRIKKTADLEKKITELYPFHQPATTYRK